MSRAGFTLAQTLVALAIAGLTSSAVLNAGWFLTRQSHRLGLNLATAARMRDAQAALDQLTSGQALLSTEGGDVRIDPHAFTFVCAGARCGVSLSAGLTEVRLETVGGRSGRGRTIPLGPTSLSFAYLGLDGSALAPAAPRPNAGIGGVELVEEGAQSRVLAYSRFWGGEPAARLAP